jgi:TPR repeat protein
MALSQIYLECLGGKKQDQALEWLELAATLGHPIAKSVIYRVSKALGCYEEGDKTILSYLIESAEAGIRVAMEDLMEVDSEKGEAVLRALKEKRYVQCELSWVLFHNSVG